MSNAALTELKAMGIPFFGTRHELIEADSETNASSSETNVAGEGRISAKHLRHLQSRMLELLEDMCKE